MSQDEIGTVIVTGAASGLGRAIAQGVKRRGIERRGGVDAIVAAAGTDSCGPLEQIGAEDWNRVVQVNLLGVAAVIGAALPTLEEKQGRVVTVASTLGTRALPDATAYCASKFGVVGFTRALAAETARRIGAAGIELREALICPATESSWP